MRFLAGVLAMLVVLIPRPGHAQSAPAAAETPRFFIDVNVFGAVESFSDRRVFTSRSLLFSEIATTTATYPKPGRVTGAALDLGGGIRLPRGFSTGLHYTRTVYDDGVGLTTTIPHPTYLNSLATASSTPKDLLERREAAVHLFLALSLRPFGRYHVRLFGGVSEFSYSAQMVRAVTYSQTFNPLTPQNVVVVTGLDSERITAHDTGLHAGGDVTYFVNQTIGISAGARVSQGTVSFTEPLSRLKQGVRVGGTQIYTGVRFRFGR
jgi:hypothetical protein